MVETLLVLVGVGVLGVLGLALPALPAGWLVAAGVGCAALGLALGVPTGLWYHLRLRACLLASGRLPPRWWLRPASLHGRLAAEERPGVLPWFALGAAGFALTVLGIASTAAGVLLEAHRAGAL